MRILWCSILSAVLLVSLTQANPVERSDDNGSAAASSPDSTESGYSLPKNVAPTAYTISLEPHFAEKNATFNGQSAIDVIISGSDTKEIVVHAVGLKFEEKYTSLIKTEDKTTLHPKKHSIDSEVNQFLTIEFEQSIAKGAYTLNLRYIGELNEEPKGFYRWKRQIDGQEVWEASTQFKYSYARRAFPCFDESAMKAKFSITIKQPKNYVVSSTVLAVRDTNNGDSPWTELTTKKNVSPDEIEFKVVYVEPVANIPLSAAATATSASPTTSTAEESSGSPITEESSGSPITEESSGSPITEELSASPITEESSGSPITEESSGSPITEESSGSEITEELSASPITEKSSGSPITEESSGSPITEESSGSPTTEQSSGSLTTEESSGSPTTEESSGSPTTDESSGSPTTNESSGSPTTDESSGSSTTDESSGSSTTHESSGSSTTDESSGSSTTEGSAGDPTAAPSSPDVASIPLPTLPLTIFTGLLVRLVTQAL